jgi:hypothetical protein
MQYYVLSDVSGQLFVKNRCRKPCTTVIFNCSVASARKNQNTVSFPGNLLCSSDSTPTQKGIFYSSLFNTVSSAAPSVEGCCNRTQDCCDFRIRQSRRSHHSAKSHPQLGQISSSTRQNLMLNSTKSHAQLGQISSSTRPNLILNSAKTHPQLGQISCSTRPNLILNSAKSHP